MFLKRGIIRFFKIVNCSSFTSEYLSYYHKLKFSMTSDPIVVETVVNAPASIVWQALTNKAKMKEWYFDLEAFKPEEGFTFQFYGGTEERQYLHLCKVVEAIPEKKISHTWMYENVPTQTKVTWELTGEDNSTSIRLIHEGVEGFPADNRDFAKENFVAGWTHIVKTALKDYVEKSLS
jgi:uncharacterized protein YndB with AHSA1/START domain